jgi:hypothetical protein
MKIVLKNIALISTLALCIISCGNKDKPQTGQIKIFITDAPAFYDKVIIDIQSVEVISDKSKSPIEVNLVRDLPINLLMFSNGHDTLLASGNVKIGTISEIRLTLGDKNSVVIGGIEYVLDIPTEKESVLNLKVEQKIEDGEVYKFWVDIDASRSIVKIGNNSYQLVPIARAISESSSGAIKGQIYPRNAQPYVWACTIADTIGTIADSTGYFLIKNLPADTYNLRILPQASLEEIIIEKIIVENGKTTDAGSIVLN